MPTFGKSGISQAIIFSFSLEIFFRGQKNMFHTKVKSLNKIFLATFFSLHKPGQKRSFFQKGFQCEFVDRFPMVFPHFFRFVRVPVVVIVAVAVVVVVVAVDVAVVVYLVVLGGNRSPLRGVPPLTFLEV